MKSLSYQVADAVISVVRYRECDAKLGQPNEKGSDGQRMDQVQVVRVTSWQHQCCHSKSRDSYKKTKVMRLETGQGGNAKWI